MGVVEDRGGPVVLDREVSRRGFLKTAAAVGAALSAAGVGGFGVAVRQVQAQSKEYTTYQGLGDVKILSFAYLLEELEGTFYDQGVKSGIFSGEALTFITDIRDNEMAHAQALASTLQKAGAPVPQTPNFTFPNGTFSDTGAFLKLAATFEPTGIGAYQGAAPALKNKDYLAAAISIHNSECRHWDAIKILQGVVPPNNVPFEKALTLQTVQSRVKPFGITG